VGFAERDDEILSEDMERERRPSLDMSVKQIAQAVRNGQKITFHIFDSEDITGYVAGEDSRYFFVLEPLHSGEFRKKLIRKETNPVMELHEANSFKQEDCYEEMNEILAGYRTYLINELRRNSSAKRRTYTERIA
jgi:hypothetical protein